MPIWEHLTNQLISPVFAQFGDRGLEPPFANQYTENITVDNTALTTFERLISNMLGLLTVLGVLIFIVYFMLGAIGWITAGGDSSKISKARDQMMQGALGLVVLVALYAVIGLISSIVGINILNPAEMLETLIPVTSPGP